jgi:antitoxin (DNA-binding transcriptional repressor) of toxin-antitoxin stability system
MRTIEMAHATGSLVEYAQDLNGEPVIITDGGKPVAALMPIESADMETISLSTNPKFLAIIERSRARQKAEGGITSAEMRRRLGLKQTSHSRMTKQLRQRKRVKIS